MNDSAVLPAPFDPAFAERLTEFSRSAVFIKMFREGMDLVEETAAYLDGPGRAAAKDMPRAASLAYAGESMRLTTRLMQMASWLMVQRAVREGEMPAADARQEKFRLSRRPETPTFAGAECLPAAMLELIARTERMYQRVRRFDETLFDGMSPAPVNAVAGQMAQIQALLEQR